MASLVLGVSLTRGSALATAIMNAPGGVGSSTGRWWVGAGVVTMGFGVYLAVAEWNVRRRRSRRPRVKDRKRRWR